MKLTQKIYKNRVAYLFILPAIAMILLFKYIPFVDALIKSTYNWNGANVEVFTGLENYKRLFHDQVFRTSMANICIYTLFTVAVNLILPFAAAVLVVSVRKRKVQNFFKLGFIVPMVVPMMVIILLWKWILAGDTGIFNQILEAVGLGSLRTPWLSNSKTALISIAFINFPWIAGLPFLLFLAGLQNIPSDIYESAAIDGCTGWRKVIHIQIPMVRSQFKLVSMYTLIGAFQLFEAPMVLTNGGPGRHTLTPALYLYQRAFEYNEFGYSATIGVVLMVVILVFTLINKKIVKDNETY